MRLQEIRDDPERAGAVLHPGRPRALVVRVEGQNLGLVDRDPDVHEIAVALAGQSREASEVREIARDLPSAERGEPAWIREMVQRDHRRNAAYAAGDENTAVMLDRSFVVTPGFRFDAAPFDRKPVRIEPERAEKIEILFVAVPMKASGAGSVPVPYLSRQLLPIPPVVPVVPALDLVRGGARTPEEAVWARSPGHAPPVSRGPSREFWRKALGLGEPRPEQRGERRSLLPDFGNRRGLPEEPLERRAQGEQHRPWPAVGADERPAFACVQAQPQRAGPREPPREKIANQRIAGQPILHLRSLSVHCPG